MTVATANPWFQLAFGLLAAGLALYFLYRVFTTRKVTTGEMISLGGALLAALVVIFGGYFAPRAGEADLRLPVEEGMTELNEAAPPALTEEEIEADQRRQEEAEFEATTKDVSEHRQEADDYIEKAINRAKERNGK